MYNGIAQNIINDPGSYSIEMLTKGVKNGTVPAYIGIPLIEQKTQELNKSKALMGGMEQGQPPIAQEVLDKAQMATGLDELSSGLPAEGFAPGGIVAFADGGEAEEDEFDMGKDEQQLFDMLRRRLASNNEYEEMAGLGALPIGISKAVETKREVSSKVGDQPKQTKSEGITQLTKEGTPHGDLINKIMMKESGGRRFDKNGNLLEGPQTKYGTAKGEMQVLDSTARDPGYGIRPARPNDPDDLARVGREYFGKMLDKYRDPKLAAIAYNWGPGNTDKWLMAGADPAKLPRETQKYSADMAGGGPVHFQSGGISDIFNMSKEEVSDFMRRKLRMEQARDAFSKVPAAAPAAAAEAAKPLSFMEYLKQGASKIRPGIGGMGVGLPALLRSGDLNEGEEAELEKRRKMPMTLGTAPAAQPNKQNKPNKPFVQPSVSEAQATAQAGPQAAVPPNQPEVPEDKSTEPEAPATVDPMGNYLGEYAAYLKDRRGQIAKDKEENKYLALLQAGLGMMGGTSRYAGANIGQGASQGVAAYLAGQKQSSADDRALQQGMLGLSRADLYDKMHKADQAQRKESKAESLKVSSARQQASEFEGLNKQLTAIEAQIGRSVDASGKLAALSALQMKPDEIAAERQRIINEILAGDSPAARRYKAITKSINKKLGVDFEEPSSGASGVLTYDRNTKTLR
jgi:hypothetical protein